MAVTGKISLQGKIPHEHLGLKIHAVETAEEAFKWIFADAIEPADAENI